MLLAGERPLLTRSRPASQLNVQCDAGYQKITTKDGGNDNDVWWLMEKVMVDRVFPAIAKDATDTNLEGVYDCDAGVRWLDLISYTQCWKATSNTQFPKSTGTLAFVAQYVCNQGARIRTICEL